MSFKNQFHLYQLYNRYSDQHQFSPRDALFCINTSTREEVWGLKLKGKKCSDLCSNPLQKVLKKCREISLENVYVKNFNKIMLTCAKISVLALSTCFTLPASFRNLAMARGDWVTSPCVLYFSYKDVVNKFQSIHTSTAQSSSNVWSCGWNPKVWPFKWKLLQIDEV